MNFVTRYILICVGKIGSAILDTLFGKEEPLDYEYSTAPRTPPPLPKSGASHDTERP